MNSYQEPSFEPVAIVGQGVVLPGGLTPQEFWENVHAGRDLLSDADDAAWRLRIERVLMTETERDAGNAVDRAANRRGGYVRGFEGVFDPHFPGMAGATAAPAVDPEIVRRLDPVFQWVLHCGREALRDAGLYPAHNSRGVRGAGGERTGLIIGNLSYPSPAFTRLVETHWMEREGWHVAGGETHPLNRFMSGMPAHFTAQALGLGGPAFALDAACASSIFAIKLACDALHDRRADVMLAGAINHADDLFLHMGFTALSALSPAGRSRPFHRDADGLVPAEGAAIFALKRLSCALRDGDRILGVIRGVGVSNDGRSRGFLAPAESGQVQAMRLAYAMSGLSPADISLIECHATGTRVGDATEIRSMTEVYGAELRDVPIGSLKSNLGHLITASGAAGLVKVLGAMRAGVRPPTLHVNAPADELDLLSDSPFRVVREAEPWSLPAGGVRRAAVSSFGFGGNNGHLLVEEWNENQAAMYGKVFASPAARSGRPVGRAGGAGATAGVDDGASAEKYEGPIAVVGIGMSVAGLRDREAFTRALFEHESRLREQSESGLIAGYHEEIELSLKNLNVPPRDLEAALPQQLMILSVAAEALRDCATTLAPDRSGVFIGMQCDTEVGRYGLRWRLADLIANPLAGADNRSADGAGQLADQLASADESIVAGLEAAGVIGTMPNIPANRINAQYDFTGCGFTVAAEELSGIRALEIATRALRAGELDAALVGAVDLSAEPVHAAAMRDLTVSGYCGEKAGAAGGAPAPGDAAITLVLKRLADARRDNDRVYAILSDQEDKNGRGDAAETESEQENEASLPETAFRAEGLFGHAHAAAGLLQLAAEVLACHHGVRLQPDARAMPVLAPDGEADGADKVARRRRVVARALGNQSSSTIVQASPHTPQRAPYYAKGPLRLFVYAGADLSAVAQALTEGRESDGGPARLSLIASEHDGPDRHAHALAYLESIRRHGSAARVPRPAGLHFYAQPVAGEIAFAFTGAASAYPGMGRELLLACPELLETFGRRFGNPYPFIRGLYETDSAAVGPFEQLCGSSFLCQIHALLSLDLLGMRPDAIFGLSSGETNSMFALGLWDGMSDFLEEIQASGMYSRELAGEYAAVRRYRAAQGLDAQGWADWRLLAPLERVRALVAREADAGLRLTIVNSPVDSVIGGDVAACERIIAELGADSAIPLGHGMAVHCPEVQDFEPTWRKLHHRPTRPAPTGMRFYSNYLRGAYVPTADSVAEALTGQALTTVDFPMIVEQAYKDGARIFVEHGPRGLLGRWISETLGEREHLCVSFDGPGDSYVKSCEAVAQLVAAGVACDYRRFFAAGSGLRADAPDENAAREQSFMRSYAAHRPAVRLRSVVRHEAQVTAMSQNQNQSHEIQTMAPAPALMSVLYDAPPSALAAGSDAGSGTEAQSEAQAGWQSLTPAGSPADYIFQEMQNLRQIHERFLHQQNELYLQFLSMRERSYEQMTSWTGRVDPDPAAYKPAPAPVPDSRLRDTPRGPQFGRAQLEIHASGKISEIFGELFKQQDGYRRQVRMPEPPLLLTDRVTGLAGEAGSMELGTVWTETDVRPDAFYLHQNYMPAGFMIESGQADLFLISWLGVDFVNRGERMYRLLGCELTYHGRLPYLGDTLRYEIHVDGHATQGDIRLFFFHYDCSIGDELRLTVRNGQAGFFTEAELADSGGVIWSPESAGCDADARLDEPAVECERESFDNQQVRACSEGRIADCFGPGYEYTQTHVRTPRLQGGDLLLFDEVTRFDPRGGPWGRGYLRARRTLAADDWFLIGHFKNDPCMPGTLMFEGCLQAMAFYLIGLGYSLHRDGWLFEPVPDETYNLICRGQATPASRELVYEIFVEEVHDGPVPKLYADILCTVDGLKAFHCHRMGLQLVPDWPITSRPELLAGYQDAGPVAFAGDFKLGYASLLACAWGRPSDAFGEMYRRYDDWHGVPRLPGPPYHFMSRVSKISGQIGDFSVGHRIEIEYDVPPRAWYFGENQYPTMPFCVLLEAALQPCGWLASFVGSTLGTEDRLFFRNLDGSAVWKREIGPEPGTLRTAVELSGISQSGPMIIQNFEVQCYYNDDLIYEMTTVFGFFPAEALANQVGLATTDEERARANAASDFMVDLSARPARYFAGSLRLPDSPLCMLDRITGLWAGTSADDVPRVRGEKDVDPAEWFFKAHFFQDPVQPGSLGLEALVQLAQFYMIENDMGADIASPRFEPLRLDQKIAWKYRGQVIPKNKTITSEIEILEQGRDEIGPFVRCQGWLWADGRRIYHFSEFGMRIVPGDPELDRRFREDPGERLDPVYGDLTRTIRQPDVSDIIRDYHGAPTGELLDPARDTWLNDHCPTFNVPALPMMSVVDRLASAALRGEPADRVVLALRDITLDRWLSFARGPLRLKCEPASRDGDDCETELAVWRDAPDPAFSRFDVVARGRVTLGTRTDYPTQAERPVLAQLDSRFVVENPYASGAMFHGPAFQLLLELRMDPTRGAASGLLDAGRGSVPHGVLHQGLLDAATHVILADSLNLYDAGIARDQVGYPVRIRVMRLYGPTPALGQVRVEARFAGTPDGERFPEFYIQLIQDDRVWCDLFLVYALFPKGRLGVAPAVARRQFLTGHRATGVALARLTAAGARLSGAEVRASDWLAGTIAAAYRLPDGLTPAEQALHVAARELVAQALTIHPRELKLLGPLANGVATDSAAVDSAATESATPVDREPGSERYRLSLAQMPFNVFEVRARQCAAGDDPAPDAEREWFVSDLQECLDPEPARAAWRRRLQCGAWPGEDLLFPMIRKFVRRFVVEDPADFARAGQGNVLYLGNHQVGIESILFAILTGGLAGLPIKTIAKYEHQVSYVGRLIDLFMSYPGVQPPESIIYFKEEEPASLLDHLAEFVRSQARQRASLMVHADGTRSVSERYQLQVVSSVLLDFAIENDFAIVPVRFAGGLPVEPAPRRLEFPLGYGSQDYYLGRAILPETLRRQNMKTRSETVLGAINGTGPAADRSTPNPPDPEFAAHVAEIRRRSGCGEFQAVLRAVLAREASLHPISREVLAALERKGRDPLFGEDPAPAKGETLWKRKLGLWLQGEEGNP